MPPTVEELQAQIARLQQELKDARREADGLREDARFLDSIVENIPNMIFLKDAEELRFVRFNRAGEKLLGFSRDDLMGKNDFDFFPEAEAQAFTDKDRQVLAAGGVHDIPEEPIHTAEQGQRWLHTMKIPIHDESGQPRYLLGISEDITERRRQQEMLAQRTAELAQANQQLRATQRQLTEEASKVRLLLARFPGAVWMTDHDLVITSVAGSRARDLDLDPDTAIGTPITSRRLADPSDHGDAPAHYAALAGQSGRYEFHTPDGAFEIWVEPLGDGSGGVIGTALDVTARRQAEAERVQTRLERAQELETLGLLAGGIAHDFNNLLASIMGNASLALSRMRPGSVEQQAIERVEHSAEAAADLTRQMLAYSGKGRFVVEPTDLSAVVAEIGSLLRVSISKRANLRFRLSEDLPPTDVDRAQIRQLVMNLLTNASDSIADDDDGTITLSTDVVEADRGYLAANWLDDDLPEGRYVALEVSDTGCGMDTTTQRRMFDPFFTTKERGHGLGMAATLGIVRGHSGAIRVYSEIGRGTTIKVLLPASDDKALQAAPSLPPPDLSPHSAAVLVVDDEQGVRAFVQAALESVGLDVMLAADGVEGVDLFRQHHAEIDVVLLDMTMPRMSGVEAFRELRRIRSDIPVILTSGYNEQEATSHFAGKGLAGFIQKPFRMGELVQEITRLVEKRKRRRST